MSRLVRSSAILLALAVALGCGPSAPTWPTGVADLSTKRTPPAGPVVGTEGRYGSSAWLGIPYAKPPVDALRWRAPQPTSWSELLDATRYGTPCPQYASPLGGVEGRPGSIAGSEDCLFLNVFTPRFGEGKVPTGDARLPVMVWIHGGGNSIGAASFYDGGNLAATEKLVVVTLNYRLGPLGWWRAPAIAAGASDAAERSGNFATLDLVRALAWVHENVSAFGGDPGNVTIFGESAGGTNVYTLLLAPQARGLFQRAIVESGGLGTSTPAEGENLADAAEPGHRNSSGEVTLRLLVRSGAAKDREAAKQKLASMSAEEVANFLRARSPEELLAAYDRQPKQAMLAMPKIFADGAVIPQGDLLARFATQGGWNVVPVIAGTNRDENKLFLYFDPTLVKQWFGILPRFVDERRFEITAGYLARMWKATGADEPAAAMRRTTPDVYVYRFDWDEEPTRLGADLSKMLGAAHGFEIPFVFGHFHLGRTGDVIYTAANEPGRKTLSHAMMSYWAEFARKGRPGRGGGDLPEWTAFDDSTPTSPRFIVLDTPEGGGLRMSSESETAAGVVASVDDDPRLETQQERCAVFRDLAGWGRGFTKAEYPTAGRQGCKEFPFVEKPGD